MKTEFWQLFKFESTINHMAVMGIDKEQQAHAAVNATVECAKERLQAMGLAAPIRLATAEVDEVFHKDKPDEKYWAVTIELESAMPMPQELRVRVPIGEGIDGE